MSRVLFRHLFAACLAIVTISGIHAAETTAKRSIKIDESKMLTLAENGNAQFEIVIPNNSSNVAKYAAMELKTCLEKTINGKIPVTIFPTQGKIALIVGDNEFTRKLGVDVKSLPRDGFVIKNFGNTIVIAGKDDPDKKPEEQFKESIWGQFYERATLFAVYDFLERFAGVRFYFPGEIGTIIRKNENLKVPSMDIVECPDFTRRSYSTYAGKLLNQKDTVYYDKNKMAYSVRMETDFIPTGHGLRSLQYINRFSKTHPEYFALLDNGKRHSDPGMKFPGQLCFSSGICEEIYGDAVAFLSGKPASSRGLKAWHPGWYKIYFNLMPEDSLYLCRCPECQRQFKQGAQATSDVVWNVVINTANRLKQNHIPGYVVAMAYSSYRMIPPKDIPDNVLVQVATLGPWGEAGASEIHKNDNRLIQDWAKKLGHKVWLWNYVNRYGPLNLPGIPPSTPHAINSYYKSMAPYICGAFLQSNTENFMFQHLNTYVFGKLCWDNSVDVDKILNEYYTLAYGPAAEPMKKFFERIEYLWSFKVVGKVSDTAEGPSAAGPSDYELWEKIYSPQEITSLTESFDLAEKLASKDPDALKRVKYIRKEFLDPLVEGSQKYAGTKNDVSELIFSVKNVPGDKNINMDGKIDDPAWQSANEIAMVPFVASRENVKTTVKALRNSDYLYFAFDCKDSRIGEAVAVDRTNDDKKIYMDSSVEIFLNPSVDRKSYYHLMVNMLGNLSDVKACKDGSASNKDWDWNSEAIVKTSKSNDGWIAEIAIPLKNLEGMNAKGCPANFTRNRVLNNGSSSYTWSPYLKNGFHEIDNFGSIFFGVYKDDSIVADGSFGKMTQVANNIGKWIIPVAMSKAGLVSLDKSTSPSPGGGSIKIECKGSENTKVFQPLPALKPNTKYRLTFYVKTEDVKPEKARGGVKVNIWDDKNRWFPDNSFTGTIPWTKQGYDFTTGPQTNIKSKSYINLLISSAQGTVWFDDIKLREIPAQ